MKRVVRALFGQPALITLLILVQIAVLLYGVSFLESYSGVFGTSMTLFALLTALVIVNRTGSSTYKVVWLLLLAVLPVFGALFYLVVELQKNNRRFRRLQKVIDQKSKPFLEQDAEVKTKLESGNIFGSIVTYVNDCAGFAAVSNTATDYLPSGESVWVAMLEELRQAKRYIFLEFFIVEEGLMWDSILEILKQKVKEGVEVRMMYDSFGCLLTLPFFYDRDLRKHGIRCRPFKRFRPFLTVSQNNRDHRKICVIDGRVAFTGGFNLADEYINHHMRFGHWRDSGVKLVGDAAFPFAVMFLQLWQLNKDNEEEVSYDRYRPTEEERKAFLSDGYVMPYSDSPHDSENVGQHIYLDIINKAQKYVYISTPYLILDDEMHTALSFAAKRGVDVRIIIPKNADHWYAYEVSKAFVHQLTMDGVKLYSYTPGFIHSKNFVADDVVAVAGSINLDFRSLYLHYECAAWLYESRAVKAIQRDFIKIMKLSRQLSIEEYQHIPLPKRLLNAVLRIFAPLM